jgi:predicted SAM-dependent methyltransferase
LKKSPSVKIHFGCGEIADARFLNVDSRLFGHVDYVTKSPMMPALPVLFADMIYACHVFEHIPHRNQMAVLARWRKILKPGGVLLLSVPDLDKTLDLYHRGEKGFGWMQRVLMGGQDYPGNFHYALFTRERLAFVLGKAGFQNIRDWHPAEQECWPRDWSWDESISLNLRAEKPAGMALPIQTG